MTVTAVIPLKARSVRLPDKNFLPLNGQPLFMHIVQTLLRCEEVSKIDIFASPLTIDRIKTEVPDISDLISCVPRAESLDNDATSITEVLEAYCQTTSSTTIVLAHATSPFLSLQTIKTCIGRVVSKKNDSAYAVTILRKFAWLNERPLNYDLEQEVPRTQDLPPIYVEQGGFYVFRRVDFETTRRRIGADAFAHEVSTEEGWDIDTPLDFRLAATIAAFTHQGGKHSPRAL